MGVLTIEVQGGRLRRSRPKIMLVGFYVSACLGKVLCSSRNPPLFSLCLFRHAFQGLGVLSISFVGWRIFYDLRAYLAVGSDVKSFGRGPNIGSSSNRPPCPANLQSLPAGRSKSVATSMSANLLQLPLSSKLLILRGWHVVWACEIDGKCQCHLLSDLPSGCCVFADVLDFIRGQSPPSFDYLDKWQFYSRMQVAQYGWCIRHSTWCAYPDADVNVSSWPCVDWSKAV